MPSTSPEQARFMAMCRHSPQHARGKCPPASVSKEFNEADKGAGILSKAASHILKRHARSKTRR